jgi:AcrR family transcriptional regulator
MMTKRRIGAEDSTTRAALLDAAAQLMLEEGYAAVTSRRVAAKAGLKPQLVHYYFRTMDDLFLAILQRGAEKNLERQERALASSQPLRSLWAFSITGTALIAEFAALANHRKAIRAEIAAYAERFRRLQVEALSGVLEGYGVDAKEFPAAAVIVLINAISRILAMERALGMTAGHAETLALVERYLTRFEGDPPAEGPKGTGRRSRKPTS